MPRQQTFLNQQLAAGVRLKVLKTYDAGLAREAFEDMDEAAQAYLWKSLRMDENWEPEEFAGPDRTDALWDELSESAREDGNLLSFFIVTKSQGQKTASLYVSPDWPSAEAFASTRSLPNTRQF